MILSLSVPNASGAWGLLGFSTLTFSVKWFQSPFHIRKEFKRKEQGDDVFCQFTSYPLPIKAFPLPALAVLKEVQTH